MSVMSTSRMLTREDLDALPEDGLRHELIDGTFIVTPSPGYGRQRISGALFTTLREACVVTGLVALCAPFDVVLGPNVVMPDIALAPESA